MNKVVRSLHRKIETSFRGMLLPSDPLMVIAVSGGPDSLALLHAINALSGKLGMSLYGAHLNHSLRGEASEADARFVADTFDSLDIPYTTGTTNVQTLSIRQSISLEQAARDARYGFLAGVAESIAADAVVLGHTMDDQAETVLMHVIRGSGITGLGGMQEDTFRDEDGYRVRLLRPMLRVTREETVAYCRAMKLEPREDESNLSSEFARNRVRHDLMPVLREFNPSIREALARLASSAAMDAGFIDMQVADAWDGVCSVDDGSVRLDRRAFRLLDISIKHHLVRRAVLRVKGDLEDIESSHVEQIVTLMSGRTGASIDLPGGLLFRVGYDSGEIMRGRREPHSKYTNKGEYPLAIPGETTAAGFSVSARVVDVSEDADAAANISPHGWNAAFDFDATGADLRLRFRRTGDRFQPQGMAGTKKIQDFMVDEKIPEAERDHIPLLISEKGIACVVGRRIAEWAKVTAGTRQVLLVSIEPV